MTEDDRLVAYRIAQAPYYRPLGAEVAIFEAAYADRIPLMLKGPTGCGKTRFIEFMAHRLGKPLVTVCKTDRRSAAAAEQLRAAGAADVTVLRGGMERWRALGLS